MRSPVAPAWCALAAGGRSWPRSKGSSATQPSAPSVAFCDAACRQAAWRRRKAGVPEATALQKKGGRSQGWREVLQPAG